jgi:phosphopantetheinyl transferase
VSARLQVTVQINALDPDADGELEPRGLAGEDLDRAARITQRQQRRHFLAARRTLRSVLAERLGCPPHRVPIRTTGTGRPELVGQTLCFSLAHRRRLCAVAMCEAEPIGVDVELIQPSPAQDRVVAELFPPGPRRAMLAVPSAQRARAFAMWWTRIESSVKACDRTLDDATECLELAPQQSLVIGRDLAAAVAVRTSGPYDVDWFVELGLLGGLAGP